MPRYGTREHQRLGLMLIALLAVAVLMLMPDFAMAAFDGSFKPNAETQTNVDSSFRAWWRFLAVPGMWFAFGALLFTVMFMGARGWYIPLAVAGIFMFGEMVIDGVKSLMG